MARLRPIALLLLAAAGFAHTQDRLSALRQGLGRPSATTVIQTMQGYNLRVWLGTNATMGEGAFTDFNPPGQVGCEYPVNSRIEHLYGAGLWVGAAIDTGSPAQRIYAVTTGYDWGSQGPRHEMYGHQAYRDTFFRTAAGATGEPNRRGVDDDGDGKADEDELDGYDNDHDWVAASDDVGADGIPDSLEAGCTGSYDRSANPDPAFDNLESLNLDLCRYDGAGNHPRKNNREIYTERNGLPDHGEPHVDEDYAAVSESDVYVGYRDLFQDPPVSGHTPLGISVFQKSYAWRDAVKEPFIIFEYLIANTGSRRLDSVEVGFFVDPLVGPVDLAEITDHKYVGYIPELRTGYANNAFDRPSTPIGVTVLGTPRPLDSLRYTFLWNRFVDNPGTDLDHYQAMASGVIKENQPVSDYQDTQYLFAFGPFATMNPGDTLRVSVALVSGDGVEVGVNPLRVNASRALSLFVNGYRQPAVPPSPPLRVTKGEKSVHLDWRWRPGDPSIDPAETWDDSDKFVGSLPADHWRRRNPPAGHTSGGRIFEGYRLWRSEAPVFVPSTFTLLREVDAADDLGIGYDTGLEFDYTDSNLAIGRQYFYAVTAYSIPRRTLLLIPDPSGGPPRRDTVTAPSVESDLGGNARAVQVPFSPSARAGEVMVVPNPYRNDRDYTFEEGGWEGYARFWTEERRVIWFTHLPAQALITIYSLAGEVVATLEHDDARRSGAGRPEGQEEWNLLSASGRAIASGVYVFTVESALGKQIGKFVVIR